MPAEIGLDRIGHLTFLQDECYLLELRHHLAAPEHSKIPAPFTRRALGDLLGNICKTLTKSEPCLDQLDLVLASDQDVRTLYFVYNTKNLSS